MSKVWTPSHTKTQEAFTIRKDTHDEEPVNEDGAEPKHLDTRVLREYNRIKRRRMHWKSR